MTFYLTKRYAPTQIILMIGQILLKLSFIGNENIQGRYSLGYTVQYTNIEYTLCYVKAS